MQTGAQRLIMGRHVNARGRLMNTTTPRTLSDRDVAPTTAARALRTALPMLLLWLGMFSSVHAQQMQTLEDAAALPVPASEALATPLPLPKDFDVKQFEALAEAIISSENIPGLALAITHRGRVLSARGYGVTDVKKPEPIDAHTVFRLASLSKSFAGTVTGLLVERGPLRWDSRVADFLPTLQLAEPEAAEHLTVADLLSHRVGLKPHTYDKDIEANAEYHNLVELLPNAPLACQPGECYGYQNVAFSLIGDIVFAASGQFYPEAVSRRIFQPLGMEDASLGLDGILASPRWARPHIKTKSGNWQSLTPKPTYYRLAPAAGVNASISDMAQWVIAQAGHRPDVLPPSLLDTLHAPMVKTPGELGTSRPASWRAQRLDSAAYGLGWRVYDYAGRRMLYHGGAVQGYRSAMAILPERELGVVLLWNSSSAAPSGLLPTILDRALGLPEHRWLDIELPEAALQAQEEAESTPPNAALSGQALPTG